MSCEMGLIASDVAEDSAEWAVLQVKVRIPRRDPRYAPLLARLDQARASGKRGRGSPLPAMVREWALIGCLFCDGKAKK